MLIVYCIMLTLSPATPEPMCSVIGFPRTFLLLLSHLAEGSISCIRVSAAIIDYIGKVYINYVAGAKEDPGRDIVSY